MLESFQMNKTELVEKMVGHLKIEKSTIERVLGSFVYLVTESLSRGEEVKIMDFGTFYVSKHNERKGFDPMKKKVITIKSMQIPRFRAGKELKAKLSSKRQ